MEVPIVTRQNAFNNFVYEQVVNELTEVNLESVPVLKNSKSEEYNKKDLKVIRSCSY